MYTRPRLRSTVFSGLFQPPNASFASSWIYDVSFSFSIRCDRSSDEGRTPATALSGPAAREPVCRKKTNQSGYLLFLKERTGRPSGSQNNGLPSSSTPDGGRCLLSLCLWGMNNPSNRKTPTIIMKTSGMATTTDCQPEFRVESCTSKLP